MTFFQDTYFTPELTRFYGDYKGTFESDHRQVKADLFVSGGTLVAYVAFAKGLAPENVTDTYLSELRSIAKALGFEGKLRLVYT